MNTMQLQALLPFLLLGGASLAVILLLAVRGSHLLMAITGLTVLTASLITVFTVRPILPVDIPEIILVDGFGLLFMGLILVTLIVITIFSYLYFEGKDEHPGEYYILLYLSGLGSAVMAISTHFVTLFVGLELLSVGLYTLVAYLRNRNIAIEAGAKYLVLAGFSSAFLLFGMALIYMETGTMEFAGIAKSLSGYSSSVLFILGMAMMVVGIGFKLALVPFHLWAADVYQGAPVPVTTLIATVSKVGVFSVLLRFAREVPLANYPFVLIVFSLLAIASMVLGNILALRQRNLKRLIAYSSIAHLGYLMVAFLPGNEKSVEASVFYLLAYSLTLLAIFGVMTMLSNHNRDAEDSELYRGLFWSRPLMALILTVALLSLAGIPLTAGFIGKFYVLLTGVEQLLWGPVIVLVLSSVIGLYYYLRIISLMFADGGPVSETNSRLPFFTSAAVVTLVIITALQLWIGVFPGGTVDVIREFLMIR